MKSRLPFKLVCWRWYRLVWELNRAPLTVLTWFSNPPPIDLELWAEMRERDVFRYFRHSGRLYPKAISLELFEALPSLESLHIFMWSAKEMTLLSTANSKGYLSRLTRLESEFHSSSTSPPFAPLTTLTQLRSFYDQWPLENSLSLLPFLHHFPDLCEIQFGGYIPDDRLKLLSPLANQLTSLRICGIEPYSGLNHLSALTALRELHFDSGFHFMGTFDQEQYSLRWLSSSLQNLRVLNARCVHLRRERALPPLPRIRELHLDVLPQQISHLTSLELLEIANGWYGGYPYLTKEELDLLASTLLNLRCLRIRVEKSVPFTALRKLTKLHSLDLHASDYPSPFPEARIKPLLSLTNLTYLDLPVKAKATRLLRANLPVLLDLYTAPRTRGSPLLPPP